MRALELAGNLGVALDPEKMAYITTNKQEDTNDPGIYAAGGICGQHRQIPKAIGERPIVGFDVTSNVEQHL